MSDVFDSTDGKLLATLDFPSYCGTDASSFRLFQISQDLSTAVTVTRQHQALAVDLNHYFLCVHHVIVTLLWFESGLLLCFCEV